MSFTKRLKEISQFNPALIYCLELQKSVNHQNSGTAQELLQGIDQIEDILQAYLYAQETILATIEKNGIASITSEQVLEWLNQLHVRIAKTLAADYKVKAGEYVKLQTFRWNPNNTVEIILFGYILGSFNIQKKITEFLEAGFLEKDIVTRLIAIMEQKLSSQDPVSSKTFVLSILEAMEINPGDAIKLVELLEYAYQDKIIEIPEDQKSIIGLEPEMTRPALITAAKFALLYHKGKLTRETKLAVENVVKIGIPPSQYPEAMKKFADNLVEAWKSCDKNDLDKVVTLASNAFYSITEIHPYFNCNGRLATCFMNIILRSLGRPSIVMTYLDEKKDLKSSYSQAIKFNNVNRNLLFQHIKNRISETEKKGAYSRGLYLDIINARFEAGYLIREIIRSFPKHDINNTLDNLLSSISILLTMKGIYSDDKDVCTLETINTLTESLRSKLNELKKQQEPKSAPSTSVPEVVQRKYTPDEVKVILEKLDTLTNQTGWESYKDGTIILLNAKDDAVAYEFVKELNKTGALKAEFKRNAKTKAPVVCLSLIKLEKLLLIETLKIENESKREVKEPKPR